MDSRKILDFLRRIMTNNNRQWFQEHKDEYLSVREEFNNGIAELISHIAAFDPSIAHLTPKDVTYRINRDTRFSADKSPYKTHMGAYIAAHGKKALHGGYYIHLEPDSCLVACGNYWLPTNILTACRNEIMSNEQEWLKCVESRTFKKYFLNSEDANWESAKGFGLEKLKSCPAGFPRDYAYIKYLRMKDYCCWHRVDDNFFAGSEWLEETEKMFKAAKPMMDFINNVIDDYE